MLVAGAPTARSLDAPPRHAVGDTVRTINDHARGHTRLPTYARDKTGRIEAVHEPHVLADANAAGLGENPEWLYLDGTTAAWRRAARATPHGMPILLENDPGSPD